MRIGIDARTLMDEHASGVPEYAYYLTREILNLDNDNDYQLFYNSFKKKSFPRINALKNKADFTKLNYPNKLLNYLFFRILSYPKIDRLTGCDLFFMPHINFISLANYSRLVLTVHDLSFIRNPEYFSRKKNIWHSSLNLKRLIGSAGG